VTNFICPDKISNLLMKTIFLVFVQSSVTEEFATLVDIRSVDSAAAPTADSV
jgi:hypothetical protein